LQTTYKDAGVDVNAGNMLTKILNSEIKSDNIGNFAGLFEHPYIPDYYLVGCTDGVGTKVIPLAERGLVNTIANDLIAMNLNDLICTGAKPLFFLDYFATNKLDVELTSKFILSLKNILETFNCTLLGGETAELGNLIKENHFDVGGFMVGIVKKDSVLKKENVKNGDVIIALKSSGPHSNGYSLIRALHTAGDLCDDLFEQALEPTYLYAKEVLKLADKKLVNACANITGGGLEDNLNRAIPNGLKAVIDREKIVKQDLFIKLQELVGEEEAYRTFNMGVGFCLVANKNNMHEIFEICKKHSPQVIGEIENI
jgi:phosphoribosylformylglycinamidine cyclo-ligase